MSLCRHLLTILMLRVILCNNIVHYQYYLLHLFIVKKGLQFIENTVLPCPAYEEA